MARGDVGEQHRARLHPGVPADGDPPLDRHPGADNALPSDHNALTGWRTQHRERADAGAGLDHHVAVQHRARTDRGARVDLGSFVDPSGGVGHAENVPEADR
jgi:hypothetical protein